MGVMGEGPRRLRTVLLYTTGHVGSATVTSRLLEASELEIVGIVRAAPIAFTRAGLARMSKHWRHVGWRFGWMLVWQRIVQAVVYGLAWLVPGRRPAVQAARLLALDRGIPTFEGSINSPEGRAFVAAQAPDLLVSAYFAQILKPEVLAIPRQGTLNVHPGWLPAYRGAMAYFWVLRNGEDRGGVTVHWIDAGVDTGEILARRACRIRPGVTQLQVLMWTAVVGARLLRRVTRALAAGRRPAPIAVSEDEARYYPMPGRGDFDTYFRERRFFRIRDVFAFLFRRARRRG